LRATRFTYYIEPNGHEIRASEAPAPCVQFIGYKTLMLVFHLSKYGYRILSLVAVDLDAMRSAQPDTVRISFRASGGMFGS